MNKILDKQERCEETVSPPGMWGAFQQHQCYNKFIVMRNGKRYCKIHDPEYVKQKDDEQTKKFHAKWELEKIRLSGPMLLRACKEALEISHNPKVEKILMDAIRKAEGG